MIMAERAWQELEQELAAWSAAGETASLWWRDDDAVEPTAALARLLDLAATHKLPLALAVVPARASSRLAQTIAGAAAEVALLQHGYAHANCAAPGQKKSELGPAPTECRQFAKSLARGARYLMGARCSTALDCSALPVLVPPWNRYGPRRWSPSCRRLGFHRPVRAMGRAQSADPSRGARWKVIPMPICSSWRPEPRLCRGDGELDLV